MPKLQGRVCAQPHPTYIRLATSASYTSVTPPPIEMGTCVAGAVSKNSDDTCGRLWAWDLYRHF
jgi:hypothetical protein